MWVAWEDGRARVSPASLLTYHYPGFFLWEGNSSQAAFTLSAPHLHPRGASGQCPPHHSGNSRQLSLSPLPPCSLSRGFSFSCTSGNPLAHQTPHTALWPGASSPTPPSRFLLCPVGITTKLEALGRDSSDRVPACEMRWLGAAVELQLVRVDCAASWAAVLSVLPRPLHSSVVPGHFSRQSTFPWSASVKPTQML